MTDAKHTTMFLDLLERIASGVIIYEPFRRTGQELIDFQDLVARLQQMEAAGLIRRLFTEKREIAGVEYFNLAMVQGGLTQEGERVLREHRAAA